VAKKWFVVLQLLVEFLRQSPQGLTFVFIFCNKTIKLKLRDCAYE